MPFRTGLLSSRDQLRIVGALALQPFIAGGVAFVLFPVLLLDSNGETLAGGRPVDMTRAAVSVALGTGLLAIPIMLLMVLPTALWVLNRRQLTLAPSLAFGLAFGNLPYGLIAIAARGDTYGMAGLIRGVTLVSLIGITGAAVFWAIVHRPQLKPETHASSGFAD